MVAIREKMDAIFLLIDSVAILDMLCSFADLVSLSQEVFTRPKILEPRNDLSIKEGRHPMLTILQKKRGRKDYDNDFVANDCYISKDRAFLILTGPNGSGKSTYIKQTVLIIILAQIGCFVPASEAIIPIRNRILSRIGSGDDMEHNISTFTMEMKEINYILENANHNSIVIIDELGRGTSNIDGISLAFAIAEELLRLKAFCLFVTHYSQITSLSTIYSSAVNLHLKTVLGVLSEGLTYLHSIGNGPCEIKSGYGIMMAKVCNFPEEMITEARNIQSVLRATNPMLLFHNITNKYTGILSSLKEKLTGLKE